MVGSYGLGVWLPSVDSTGTAGLSMSTSSFRRAKLLCRSPARVVIESRSALAKAAGVPGIPIFESITVEMRTKFMAASAHKCSVRGDLLANRSPYPYANHFSPGIVAPQKARSPIHLLACGWAG